MADEPRMPKELASAVNLMAHPAAGAAAFSAIGIGMASHAFGLWLGAVEAAAELSQRMLSQAKPLTPVMPAARSEPKAAAAKAQAATKILMADAQSFARDVQADAEVKLAPADVAPPAKPAPLKLAPAAPAEVQETPAAPAYVQPKALKKPAKPDDLKAISGIGPKLETVLNGLGVWTYRQIAGWTDSEIGWVDEHLSFGGRIVRDDWTGQAKKLRDRKP